MVSESMHMPYLPSLLPTFLPFLTLFYFSWSGEEDLRVSIYYTNSIDFYSLGGKKRVSILLS